MNGIYDRVTTVTRRRASASTPALERANGYAVRVGEGWFWFPAIEPAYVFARTARMSPAGGASIHIVEAAHETRFDDKLGRDVRFDEVATEVQLDVVEDSGHYAPSSLKGARTRDPHPPHRPQAIGRQSTVRKRRRRRAGSATIVRMTAPGGNGGSWRSVLSGITSQPPHPAGRLPKTVLHAPDISLAG